MVRNLKRICFASLLCILVLGSQTRAHAQNMGVPREPSPAERDSPQSPSATKRILRDIARAVVRVLCVELGDCPPVSETPTETPTPTSREFDSYRIHGLGRNLRSPQDRSFSFDTPIGWQAYEEQSSVTVAPPSEYSNGNLMNGVILGLTDLGGASFESGTDKYVRGLLSVNKYLAKVGRPQSDVVNGVLCITTRLEGLSPQTNYTEKVVVYTCKRNAAKLFYVVNVNSGPNASRYEVENSRVTQSISFR